jgi:hypothetical protein
MPNFYDEFHGKGGLYVMAADGVRRPVDKLPSEPEAEPEVEPVKVTSKTPAPSAPATKVSTDA